MSPVAAAVAVYVLALSAGIAVYAIAKDSLDDLYERLRWRLAKRRPTRVLAGVLLAATALTAALATHAFGSNGPKAGPVGTPNLQAAPGSVRPSLPPPRPASSHRAVAHFPAHATTRARSIARSRGQQQTAAPQATFVSDVRTASAPTVEPAVAPAPSPLRAPKGASAPSPLKAP